MSLSCDYILLFYCSPGGWCPSAQYDRPFPPKNEFNLLWSQLQELFQFDGDFQTSLDLAQLSHSKVKTLVELEVLLLDESSMLDGDGYSAIEEVLSITDHNRRPNGDSHDSIGNMHLLLFGDFKQLPPATSKPSFIVIPSVTRDFEFRSLRENRRVVTDEARREEIDGFHQILSDISWGIASDVVKNFIVQAYVRGTVVGNAEHCELENSTAVFTKRRCLTCLFCVFFVFLVVRK